jgi:hypothetical protein
MLNDALLQMQRRLDDNDLTEAGGAAGIKLRLRSSEKRRFTRNSASGEHTKQSTFQTTKDDSVLDAALRACGPLHQGPRPSALSALLAEAV